MTDPTQDKREGGDENTDFQQRCCQCGRTESWLYEGGYMLIVCACGHDVCGECQPYE